MGQLQVTGIAFEVNICPRRAGQDRVTTTTTTALTTTAEAVGPQARVATASPVLEACEPGESDRPDIGPVQTEPKAPYNCLGFCTFISHLPGEKKGRLCFRPCARGLWADVEGQHRGDCRCELHFRNRFAELEKQGSDSDDSYFEQVCRATSSQGAEQA